MGRSPGKATDVTKRRSGAPSGRIWPLRRQIDASPQLDLTVECQIQPWDLVGKHQIRCFRRQDLAFECQIWPLWRQIDASPRLDLAVECQIQPWDLVYAMIFSAYPFEQFRQRPRAPPTAPGMVDYQDPDHEQLRKRLGPAPSVCGGQQAWSLDELPRTVALTMHEGSMVTSRAIEFPYHFCDYPYYDDKPFDGQPTKMLAVWRHEKPYF
ncbi:Uncharacterized protein TCM_026717 [Theobroma cacao]|uniref:Uncharacterized protein n=1 Tax=Theobroma cacao TaxID=3641 RepID=A0A061F4G9_THECC|nr:Uncharacterized protein TCM_026717 [Theobroma cacao]